MKRINAMALVGLLVLVAGYAVTAQSALDVKADWQTLVSSDGSVLTARHESAAVVVGDAVYLIGGRGNRPVERYTPATGQWDNLGLAPLELNHIQPVAIGHEIFVIGAFTGPYPRETTVAEIHVFDTNDGEWEIRGSMPESRRRGSVAAALRQGKIYVLGGNTRGHDGGAVAWFDEFDPATGQWRVLPDAPHARDHFSATVIGDLLIAAGGRQTALPNPAANPVTTTDIYDFSTGQWREAASIPTPRAGAMTVRYGNDVLVAGGEINTESDAVDAVESFDVATGQWQSLPSMTQGRHSGGGAIVGERFYVFSGAPTIGGASELPDSEWLSLPALPDGGTMGTTGAGGEESAGTDTAGADSGGSDTSGTETGGVEAGGTDTGGTDTGGGGTGESDTGNTDTADAGSTTSTKKKSGASSVWMLLTSLLFVFNRRRHRAATA